MHDDRDPSRLPAVFFCTVQYLLYMFQRCKPYIPTVHIPTHLVLISLGPGLRLYHSAAITNLACKQPCMLSFPWCNYQCASLVRARPDSHSFINPVVGPSLPVNLVCAKAPSSSVVCFVRYGTCMIVDGLAADGAATRVTGPRQSHLFLGPCAYDRQEHVTPLTRLSDGNSTHVL